MDMLLFAFYKFCHDVYSRRGKRASGKVKICKKALLPDRRIFISIRQKGKSKRIFLKLIIFFNKNPRSAV